MFCSKSVLKISQNSEEMLAMDSLKEQLQATGLKGCVRCIFADLFYMSKTKHLWNKENKILFHFESSFCSWDNQILTFSVWNAKPILNNLGSKHSLVGNQIWPVYVIVQNKFFIKKFYEKWSLETSSRLFLIFEESSVKRILRRAACWFGQILIVLLLHI